MKHNKSNFQKLAPVVLVLSLFFLFFTLTHNGTTPQKSPDPISQIFNFFSTVFSSIIQRIINFKLWWQFAIWVTIPYIGALFLYALTNILITNRWVKKFGFNIKNRIPVLKSSMFKGLLKSLLYEIDGWGFSVLGLIVFSLAVILLENNPGVIKWGYIGSFVGLLFNSILVFASRKGYDLKYDFIIPKILECINKWKSEQHRLKTISLEKVLERLSDEPNIRSAAIIILAKINPVKAFKDVLAKINDDSDKVRLTAVKVLGQIGINKAIEPLLKRLADGNEKVRSAVVVALEILGTTDELLVTGYINALKNSSDPFAREEAAKELSLLKDNKAIEPLLERLADGNEKVRSAVVKALELLCVTDKQFLSGYINALKIPECGWDDNHIKVAIESLGELRDEEAFNPILEKLKYWDDNHIKAAIEALGKLKDEEAFNSILEKLRKLRDDIRSAAIISIAKINPVKAYDYILANLYDKSSALRSTAATVLGQLRDKRAIKPLLERLADRDEKVRSAVVKALKLLGVTDEQVSLGYINALNVPECGWDDNHIEAAIESLGELKYEQAFNCILEKLKWDDNHIKAAIEAFGELINVRAFNPILDYLKYRKVRDDIRSAAIISIAKINPDEAYHYVLAKLDDESDKVRSTAATVLGQMGKVQAIPHLEELWSRICKSKPEEGPWGEHWSSYTEYNPEYDAIKNALEILRKGDKVT